MFKPVRLVPVALAVALLAAGGCARTDDGTVVIPRELDARRIWDRGAGGTQTPPVRSGSDVFPVVAPPAVRTLPPRKKKAAPGPVEKTISCSPAKDSGGRVRMVCR